MENCGKGVSAASWPGWSRRDINSTDEKIVLGKKNARLSLETIWRKRL